MLDESRSPTGEMGQMLEQREPGQLNQGRETDMEVRRRRKETSQVMIHADVRVTYGAFLLFKLF